MFEGCLTWQGDFWATRMVLESTTLEGMAHNTPALPLEEAPNTGERKEDDRAQLNILKRRKGTWGLAPTLITSSLLARKDILMSVGKAMWKLHAARARDLKSPGDVARHYIEAASRKAWTEKLVEMVANSL